MIEILKITAICDTMILAFKLAPVAQPDRASDFGSEGYGFESYQARQFIAFNDGC